MNKEIEKFTDIMIKNCLNEKSEMSVNDYYLFCEMELKTNDNFKELNDYFNNRSFIIKLYKSKKTILINSLTNKGFEIEEIPGCGCGGIITGGNK